MILSGLLKFCRGLPQQCFTKPCVLNVERTAKMSTQKVHKIFGQYNESSLAKDRLLFSKFIPNIQPSETSTSITALVIDSALTRCSVSALESKITCLILPEYRNHRNENFSLPSITNQNLIFHYDLPLQKIIPKEAPTDKMSNMIEPPLSHQQVVKQAAVLIQIRKKKMKKHKLKKLRKRMRFVWARVRQKREKRKEKHFQAELLSQVKEAESFNAKEYVHNVIHRIRNKPKPETHEEKKERIRELIRQNRGEINYVKPKFD
ncbi:uncharacterized protein LOC106467155 [Limulus polyphemus]|uniref:Small ribosomal subunit protein mS38 n=1 Tax=Limulus polyphemus TaxID=6850 RepID=A0ABM1T538_LIMPO|nr:uncharacterized protein LOC106467155 [Limulus polyphemus]